MRNTILIFIACLLVGCQTTHQALQMREGEELLETQPANLWRGIDAVGGTLIITSQRLFFQPHSFNIQRTPEEISLSRVVEIKPATFRWLWVTYDNNILLRLNSGTEYQFVVSMKERNRIIEELKVQVQHQTHLPSQTPLTRSVPPL